MKRTRAQKIVWIRRLVARILLVLSVYTIGPTIYLLRLTLEATGKLVIINKENIPRLGPRMAILPNHPDLLNCMYEIFLVISLFWPQIFWHPIRMFFWFTPDDQNFDPHKASLSIGGVLGSIIEERAIFSRRKKNNGRVKEVRGMIDALDSFNGVLLHFAEEGRTCTGTEGHQVSKKRKMLMRTLKKTIGWLLLKTRSSALPIWLENGPIRLQPGKKLFSSPRFAKGEPVVTVKIGKLISFESLREMNAVQVTNVIQSNLMMLADQQPVRPKG